jgi:hypothetical protein
MAEHLEVLRVAVAARVRLIESMREADAVHRGLAHAADLGGRLDAEQIKHRRRHVDDVRVLRTNLTRCLDPLRPGNDERVTRATAVGLALPAAERCVARPRPPPRVMIKGRRAADLVDSREAFFERLLCIVEELRLIRGAGRAALGARAVVGDDHDQCVLELAAVGQELQQAADLVIGVREEAGEHFHHPAVQLSRWSGQ